jgi:hypothetical protein
MDTLHEQIQALHRGETITVSGVDRLFILRDYLYARGERAVVERINVKNAIFDITAAKLRPRRVSDRRANAGMAGTPAAVSAAAAAYHASAISTGTGVQQGAVAVAPSERLVRGCGGFAFGILVASLIGRWGDVHGWPLVALGILLPVLGALLGGLPAWRGK